MLDLPTNHAALRPNAADLGHFWMPFTDNRFFKAHPRLLAEAQDMIYRTPDGAEIFDGTAGLWSVNAGHGRVEIADAVAAQARTLDFAPTFQLGASAGLYAGDPSRRADAAGLDRILFTNSGSKSADTSLKIALAYQQARGEGARTRLIGRARGYHGTNFGGMAVGASAAIARASRRRLPGSIISARRFGRTMRSRAASRTGNGHGTSWSSSWRCTARRRSRR